MKLHYVFEDVEINVTSFASITSIEPTTHKERTCVEYDYDVEIELEDIIDYFKPRNIEHLDFEEQCGFKNAIQCLWKEMVVDVDTLEDDESFIDFMKERYYDKAYEQCADTEWWN